MKQVQYSSNNLPELETTVMDTSKQRVGRVMGYTGPYVQLRPLNGGREWDSRPENLQKVKAHFDTKLNLVVIDQ